MTSTPTRFNLVTFFAGVLFVGSLTGVFTAPQQTTPVPATSPAQGQLATIQQYCVACHNDRTKTAGVSFQGITPESINQHADVFEKAVRKMRGRVMPPPGARQPGTAAVDSLVAYLEDSLDRADTKAHVPDQVVLHRLNRKEYANAGRRHRRGLRQHRVGLAGVALVHRAVRDRRTCRRRESGGPS